MESLARLKKLHRSLGELERFQKQNLERVRIAIDAAHREREGYLECAGRMAELMPGSRSLFLRMEESRQRILTLEKMRAGLQKKLLRTSAMLKAVDARTDRLKDQLERREFERVLDSIVPLEPALAEPAETA